MAAIKQCHDDNPYAKFLGVCNDHKTALNLCLRKEVRRRLPPRWPSHRPT